jgi:hypothetical protein
MDRATQRANQAARTLTQVTGTTYTVQPQDRNCILAFTAATAVTVTLPNSFPAGFEVELVQMGAGAVSTSAAAGGSQVSPGGGAFATASQYGALRCMVLANAGGSVAQWNVVGARSGSYNPNFSISGPTPVASEPLYTHFFQRAATYLGNFAGSQGGVDKVAGVNPASNYACNVYKNGGAIGTVTYTTAGAALFATTGGAAGGFAAGDCFSVIANATVGVIANFAATFAMLG